MAPHRTERDEQEQWWQSRWLFALVLLSAVPLLWPEIPPLVDLPGHMARYEVQMELANSPGLQRFYRFEWGLIGNLGVDLLVVPLSKLFGLELAVKLIVLSIPIMTAFGFLWVAREVAHKEPPTAWFALPFAYNFPFNFGFVNFALSMAFALLAFAFWLRLARFGRFWLRAALFVPISLLLWVTHTYGWGTLGVLAFSAELVRQVDRKKHFIEAAFRSGIHCLSLVPPMLLIFAWRSSGQVRGRTADWFNWERKWDWLVMALRDRWAWFDVGSLVVIGFLLLFALFHRRLEYSRNLAASAIFLAVVYVLLPRIVFGSAYADMRLVPYMIGIAVIAIRLREGASRRLATGLAVAGLAFFFVRTAGTTISYWLYDRSYDRNLAALDHVPRDARLVSFVGTSCNRIWSMSRLEHLPGLAVVRRHAFSNDQWSMPGAQLLTVNYPAGRGFSTDPTQMVTSVQCPREAWRPVNKALALLPREAFDYVWLIEPPAYNPELTAGLQPVWREGASVLYRIVDRRPPGAPKESE